MSGSAAIPAYGFGVAEPIPDLIWYKMNEGSGSTLTDSSASGNNGTNQTAGGTCQYVTGKSGSGFALQGLTASPRIGEFTSGTWPSLITVCAWIKAPASQVSDAMFLEMSTNSFNTDRTFYWDYNGGDGTNVSQFHIRDGGHLEKLVPNPSADTWHHWGVVFDNSTSAGDITIYLDGATTSPTIFSNTKPNINNFAAATTVYIGTRAGAFLNWDGTVDDLRIYTGQLTQEQVQAVMNNPQ